MSEAPPVNVMLQVADEFEGPIKVQWVFSEEDALKVTRLGRSVASLYFGHHLGPDLQEALKTALELPLEP